jgi:lysozyme
MKMSANGLALVMAFEGCEKKVKGRPGWYTTYLDSVGVLTIGWGHTNDHEPKFKAGEQWSQERCDAALAGDMAVFEKHVESMARVPLQQHEFDAMVSWAFNTGGPATATLWKKLNAGDRAAVPKELTRWNKAGGKVLPGLVRRRKAEALMFQGNVAEALRVAGVSQPAIAYAASAPISAPQQQATQEAPSMDSKYSAAIAATVTAVGAWAVAFGVQSVFGFDVSTILNTIVAIIGAGVGAAVHAKVKNA